MANDQHFDHGDFDYEEVDFATGQPYAQWQRARERCPVIRSDESMMGFGRPSFQITRRDDVEAVLRDATTFSSSINLEHMLPYMGELILGMDRQRTSPLPQSRRSCVPRLTTRAVGSHGDSPVDPDVHRRYRSARSRRPRA